MTILAEDPPRPAKARRSRTITTDLFDRIRSDILHLRLDPGSRLRLVELRRRYQSSLTPLREALMRLGSEDLVILTDHKGFCVAPVSREEMVDIAETLFELEAAAVRRSIKRGDLNWEANIVGRFHALSRCPILASDGTLDPEWEARNVAFHESVYAACGSPSIIRFCRQLSERHSRYRRLWARHMDRNRDVSGEHEAIMRAVIARDEEASIEAIRRHRMITIEAILAHWNDD